MIFSTNLVWRVKVDAIERAGRHCLAQGITSVVDAGVGLRAKFQEWFAYQEAKRSGRLPVRAYLSFTGGPDGALADAKEAGLVTGVGDEWMRVGPVKFWADGSAGGRAQLQRLETWYSQKVASLLGKMEANQSPDGRSLLDDTVVLWMNEVGKGNNHAHRDLPFLLAGGAGGQLRTGRFLDFAPTGGRPHNDLLVSLANLMGLPDRTFGDPQHCTGPLPL